LKVILTGIRRLGPAFAGQEFKSYGSSGRTTGIPVV
jgi:hypothetical protein